MRAEAEFDEYSDSYTQRLDSCVRMSGQDSDYFAAVKADELLAEFASRGIDPESATVVDFGCGTGTNSVHLEGCVGRLIGTDVAGTALGPAATRSPLGHFVHTDEIGLPLRGDCADAALVSCVLHHIEPESRRSVLNEIRRVLKPTGFVLVVEHNPFNPATRLIVNRCEFDQDAILLTKRETCSLLRESGFQQANGRFILFVPGRSAFVGRVNRWLSRVPLGAQYAVAGNAS